MTKLFSLLALPLAAWALPEEDFDYYAVLAGVDLSKFKDSEIREWRAHFTRHVDEESDLTEKNLIEVFREAEPMVSSVRSEKLLAAGNKTWEHHESPRFKGWSVRDTKALMGTFIDGPNAKPLPETYVPTMNAGDLPATFDVKEAFPECASVSGHIRDQATCGSCWAHSSTETFNDRKCIATGGDFQTLLSTQHTTSCCGALQCMSFGCNGGNPGFALHWMVRSGVVTGGDYGDVDMCWPYALEPCAHHVEDPKLKPCSGDSKTPACSKTCQKGYDNPFDQDKTTGTKAFNIRGVDSIKENLVKYGSVSAAFTVYDDFPNYKSGVYTPTSHRPLGGHAVKIVGWGTEGGLDYWLINNSWNEGWGDKGTFKIKMGVCGINDQISAAVFDDSVQTVPESEDVIII